MNFREFEHDGWEKLPKRYHDAFHALTTQAVEPLLDSVLAKKGTRLLDVATGPGYVAAAATARGAEVTGLDFAAAMVAEASRRYPAVKFQEGDAEDLPFPDASFDAVTMNFGLLHLGRPERALAEACRVLRRDGRFAFTVWAKPEEARGFAIVLGAIQKHGEMNVPLPSGPPFFRFSDPEAAAALSWARDFRAPWWRACSRCGASKSPQELRDFMLGSTVRTGALLRAQTPQALAAIRSDVIAAAKNEVPMPAVLASASK